MQRINLLSEVLCLKGCQQGQRRDSQQLKKASHAYDITGFISLLFDKVMQLTVGQSGNKNQTKRVTNFIWHHSTKRDEAHSPPACVWIQRENRKRSLPEISPGEVGGELT